MTFAFPRKVNLSRPRPSGGGEGWLAHRQAHAIDGSACGGVDLLFHLLGEALLACGRSTGEVRHLANLSLLRLTETLCAKFAGTACRLRAFEFERLEILDGHIIAVVSNWGQ